MVHAREKIRRLLKPSGRLIDIHPMDRPPPVAVRLGPHTHRLGYLRETDDSVEYRQADAAVAQVVREGLFAVEHTGEFPFHIYTDAVAELQAYLAEEWKDAVLEDAIAQRAAELLGGPEGDKELFVQDHIHIARLRPVFAS